MGHGSPGFHPQRAARRETPIRHHTDDIWLHSNVCDGKVSKQQRGRRVGAAALPPAGGTGGKGMGAQQTQQPEVGRSRCDCGAERSRAVRRGKAVGGEKEGPGHTRPWGGGDGLETCSD